MMGQTSEMFGNGAAVGVGGLTGMVQESDEAAMKAMHERKDRYQREQEFDSRFSGVSNGLNRIHEAFQQARQHVVTKGSNEQLVLSDLNNAVAHSVQLSKNLRLMIAELRKERARKAEEKKKAEADAAGTDKPSF